MDHALRKEGVKIYRAFKRAEKINDNTPGSTSPGSNEMRTADRRFQKYQDAKVKWQGWLMRNGAKLIGEEK